MKVILKIKGDKEDDFLHKEVEMEHPPHKGEEIGYFYGNQKEGQGPSGYVIGTVIECTHTINGPTDSLTGHPIAPLTVEIRFSNPDELLDSLVKDGWKLPSRNLE